MRFKGHHSRKGPRKIWWWTWRGSAFLEKTLEHSCAYCKGQRVHQQCMNETSVEEQRRLSSIKYGRCFICARKGHVSSNCDSKMLCNYFTRSHYISICNSYNAYKVPCLSSRANNGDGWYKPTLSRRECPFFASERFHVDSPCRVDREFVMTFQEPGSVRGKNGARFEYNFVFNDRRCLNKGTSSRMSCSERTADHPSWRIVR